MIQNLNCIISHYSIILLKLYIYLLFNFIHYTDKVMFLLFNQCTVFVPKSMYILNVNSTFRFYSLVILMQIELTIYNQWLI